MNIKHDLETFLDETGWDIPKLVIASGANKDSLYRLINGSRQGLSYKTLQKLWPFIYGDQRPEAQSRGDVA